MHRTRRRVAHPLGVGSPQTLQTSTSRLGKFSLEIVSKVRGIQFVFIILQKLTICRHMQSDGPVETLCNRPGHFMRSITLVSKDAQPPGMDYFWDFQISWVVVLCGGIKLTNNVWSIWNPVTSGSFLLGCLPAPVRGGPSGASEVRGL